MPDGIYFAAPPEKIQSTLLYSIAPRGIGTGQVESMHSYIYSLAREHRLAASPLVDFLMTHPTLDHLGSTIQMSSRPTVSRRPTVMHSLIHGPTWVRIFEIATGRDDLRHCTLQPLRRFVNQDRLIKGVWRVCPDCIASDIESGQAPYGRLLWDVAEVTCCPIHRTLLVEETCGAPAIDNWRYGRTRVVGTCSNCGSVGYACSTSLRGSANDTDVWVAEQIASVIAELPNLSATDPRQFKSALKQDLERRRINREFEQRTGVHRARFFAWLRVEDKLPSLNHLLRYACSEGLELCPLFKGILRPSESSEQVRSFPSSPSRRVTYTDEQCAHVKAVVESGGRLTAFWACNLKVSRRLQEAVGDQYQDYLDARARRIREERMATKLEAIRAGEDMYIALRERGMRTSSGQAGVLSGERWSSLDLKVAVLVMIRNVIEDKALHIPLARKRTLAGELGPEMDAAIARVREKLKTLFPEGSECDAEAA